MRNFHFNYLSHKNIYVGPVSQTGLAGLHTYYEKVLNNRRYNLFMHIPLNTS